MSSSESVQVRVVDDRACDLGEGPVWHPERQSLLFVDILGKKLLEYKPSTKERSEFSFDSPIGCFAGVKGKPNVVIVATAEGFQEFDMGTKALRTLVKRTDLESHPNNRFNDGKVDPFGRFWAGTMDLNGADNKHGSLYRMNHDGSVACVKSGISISNGIVWSLDGARVYFVDSCVKTIEAYDVGKDCGSMSNERVIARMDLPEAVFDGMTIDANGNLWVALWEGSCVRCYNPETGAILHEVSIPALYVTSCCFGGPDLSTLFVTTADRGTSDKFPDAGKTFEVTGLGVKGVSMGLFVDEKN